MGSTECTILIVEDDDTLFESMRYALLESMTEHHTPYTITRAPSLREAIAVWESKKVIALSIDMQFPIFTRDRVFPENGAELITHFVHSKSTINFFNGEHTVLYTGLPVEETCCILKKWEIDGALLPRIFQKGYFGNHSRWAEAVYNIAKHNAA